jgi:hypothetical protein
VNQKINFAGAMQALFHDPGSAAFTFNQSINLFYIPFDPYMVITTSGYRNSHRQ